MGNLQNNTNQYIYKTQTHSRENKAVVTKGVKKRGETNQGCGIGRYKLILMPQIGNKNIPHSTGDYIHYLTVI